jgi:hypothetical protein
MRLIFCSIAIPLVALATVANSQSNDRAEQWRDTCERDSNSSGGRFCEVRTSSVAPSTTISVEGGANGGVAFYGEDRKDVMVVARIQSSADDDTKARDIARQVRVLTDGGRIWSEGPAVQGTTSWSVSYDVYVPIKSNLAAVTQNGGISVEQVRGEMSFESTNGGINLSDVGGNIRGRSTNGGVLANLSGMTWQGKGLDLQTTNGSATVNVPPGYNALLETGTDNGASRVDIPVTVKGSSKRDVSTQLGSGGPIVRVVTMNGGVHIAER